MGWTALVVPVTYHCLDHPEVLPRWHQGFRDQHPHLNNMNLKHVAIYLKEPHLQWE